ncbi:hypothetical protein BDZ85DRAFT_254369 [Elsinoe ampelina]|uniref:Uncharacterized protein n=1 Tax=Elsinoe ampelina TaxID=302913 RepID=A0A6A6GPB8_9PEZI|nr:hypothetical protein BDZ85DRAFT_254369 [Elsinoe ampelina]
MQPKVRGNTSTSASCHGFVWSMACLDRDNRGIIQRGRYFTVKQIPPAASQVRGSRQEDLVKFLILACSKLRHQCRTV